MPSRYTPDDEATAVAAHALIASLGVIQSGATALGRGDLDAARRKDIADLVIDQAEFVRGVLRDLATGLTGDALRALHALSEPGERRTRGGGEWRNEPGTVSRSSSATATAGSTPSALAAS